MVSSAPSTSKHSAFRPSSNDEPEERKALLNAADEEAYHPHGLKDDDDDVPPPKSWSRRKIVTTAFVLIGLLVTGTFARTLLWSKHDRKTESFYGQTLRSNGTEGFQRTVIIVSIDGLRYAIYEVQKCASYR